MARKKVKLEWIVKDASRKASLKKRGASLLKKVNELTTLCGVKAFVLIYSPDEREPKMWPTRPVLEQLLARFNNMQELEKGRKMVNQETYLKEKVLKVQDKLKKQSRENKEMEVSYTMEQLYHGKTLDDFNVNELQDLVWFSIEKKNEIRKRIENYQQINPFAPQSFPPPPPPPSASTTSRSMNSSAGVTLGPTLIDMMNNDKNITSSGSTKAISAAGITSHIPFASTSCAANQLWLRLAVASP